MTDDHQRASRAPRARVITFVVPPGERRHYGIPAEFGWLLAAAGRHVLIADGTSTTTDLQGALGCFPSVLPHTDSWLPVQDLAAATGDRRLNTATLRRFLPPWRSTDLDVIAWRVPPKAFRFGPAPEVATAIRSVFARLPFDVVLLLSSVAAAPRIADISDVVAVCLPMTEPGARIAASTLREIEAAIWEENPATDAAESPAPPGPGSRRPTLAGIATSKTSEDPERVRRVLAAFRNGVGELARSSLWLGAVQLPIPPYSEDRPLLTTLFEDPGSAVAADNSANRTFGDLIALLSGETAGTRRLPPPQLCRRYRERVVDGPTGAGADRVVVAYAPEDRGWADWVRSELSSAGVATSLLPRRGDLPTLAKDDTVVCLGPSDRFPPPVRTLLAMATNRADPRQRPELVYVRMPGVDDQLAPENIDPAVAHIVDIAGSVPAGAGTAAGRSTMEDLSGTWIRRASVATAAHAEECSARIRAPFLRPERGEVSKRGIRSTQRRGDTHWQARFPLHSRPRYAANVAAPNYRFIGRDAEVEGVRDGLLSAGIRVLSGKAGVGKSEIARSYVSRFQHDYDVTWWVPCQDTRSIRASLEQLRKALAARAELAHAIEVAARGTTPGSEQDPPPAPPVFSLLAALRAGTTDHAPIRCLLVYDDADRLTELSGLLPAPGIAHVVVTTRDTRLSDLDHPSTREPLDVTAVVAWLSPQDSVAILTRRFPMLEPTAAELIARRLDHAPLALQLAQATLQERVPELRARALCGPQLAQRAAEDYLAALPEHGSATAKALTVTIDTLWRSGWVGQLAVQLARMAAFLAPGGPVLALLRSTSMLRQLGGLTDTAAPPEDLVWIDEVLRVGDRFNLFRVDWLRTSSLRIHRSISELLKEMMAPEHRAAISTAVQRGLASCAPNEAELEEASHLPRQRELHRHLLPSEALLARDPQVRRWVVKQLRYAQLYGDASAHAEALRAATLVRRRWLADPTEDVDLLPRLDEVRANLCQVLGRRQEALDLQRGVLERLRISLGSNHLRTYQASDVLGWHLRSLGRFTEANLASDTAYEGLRRVLGANHPITLRAGFNHSYILFLSGEQQRAIELGVEILERWEKQAGRGDKMTWRCAARLGKYLHHVGDDKSAAGLLDRALEAAQAERRLAGLGAQASGARWESVASPPQTDFIRAIELEIQRDLAAVRRSDGRIALAHALDKRTLRQHGEGFHDHHEMLACQLAIAADEHALGQATRAVESAKRAMAGFATLPKTHSFRYLCQLDLGVFQHSAGQRGQATTNIEQACDGLYATLGEHHPWSVAATHNRNLMRSATATRHWIVIDLP